jgi:hypothetical protein
MRDCVEAGEVAVRDRIAIAMLLQSEGERALAFLGGSQP